MLSLLYFIRNDYRRAHFYADLVLDYRGRNNNGMAQYIYAVTGLYLNKDSYDVLVNEYLRKSLLEDDENPLIPQLLGIFVERSLLAASLGNISLSDPVELFDILAERKSLSIPSSGCRIPSRTLCSGGTGFAETDRVSGRCSQSSDCGCSQDKATNSCNGSQI